MDHKIAIIGLGYVGLPLAVEFSKKYDTIGFDINDKRISELKSGIDHTREISSDDLISAKLTVTNKLEDIADSTIYIVTVPTPIDQHKRPDFSPLISASKTVASVLKKDNIVIYESTVYPGATEEVCVPILENNSGLKFNQDFTCGYSPERINPGDKEHTVSTIKKITSGSSEKTAEIVDHLDQSII
ncbi:MAG: hypothetical protein KDD94_12740, partial [Calditrichaeota bacterium]|nr:hypothetical protein [Calditrichota bacterium]